MSWIHMKLYAFVPSTRTISQGLRGSLQLQNLSLGRGSLQLKNLSLDKHLFINFLTMANPTATQYMLEN
jgi:hypothetical protein